MERANTDLLGRLMEFCRASPVQFVAVAAFAVMAGIPVATFLAYVIGTLIASLVGALVLEVVLLFGGVLVLGFVLFVVVAITACITAIFASVYYACKATIYAVDKGRQVTGIQVPSTEGTNAEVDSKNKPLHLSLPEHILHFEFETARDFIWTATITLFLLSSISLTCVMVVATGYFVIALT